MKRRIAGALVLAGMLLAPVALAGPCGEAAVLDEFAFWIGAWDVHAADGTYAGHNRIEAAEDECRIDEHWTSTNGGTGSSINFRDPIDGQWEQVWHSQNGIFIRIRGGLTGEDDMLLEGNIHYLRRDVAAPFRGRWTLLEDGRVRQFFEQFDAETDAWQPWFEGFYSRSRTRTEDSP
jgi:hypothetical protein